MRHPKLPEHHIQRRIYNRLVGAKSLRYSQLKPKEMEANSFMYHLKELIKAGLVQKEPNGAYCLSSKGKALATRFSIRESNMRVMPTTLSVIYLQHTDGQVLLYERARQPYIGALGFPSGKIHLGETLYESAHRELSEKCGYDNQALELKGEFSLVSREGEFIENHVLGHIWFAVVDEKKTFSSHAGKTFWSDWQVEDYNRFIPGFKEIIQACQDNDSNKFILDLKM